MIEKKNQDYNNERNAFLNLIYWHAMYWRAIFSNTLCIFSKKIRKKY